ncbi:UDP-4-amino-4,6-dideoxy-N-acetyl-beta-L-altrosamine transaminase [Candidatus Micrarchaeota archaeon]|nr:UDP-4-amino-4,6-dideoxy-N-acetyl-beta-L-altrosamine transaminase [Candidatus Micrarchaeota archaeon]
MIPYGKQEIDQSDIDAVIQTLKGDWITSGPKIDEFEKAIAEYVGAKHAVAVNSGTSALDIAVGALELPEGSEIITTPFTFVATSNCILYNGCKPIFADIDLKTYNIDPDEIRKKITKKTKAIIYVDYAGQPCDIDEIREIAQEHDLKLIEDAAHAIGAEYKGKKVGSLADMTEFSFHPVKHITTGEGGIVTSNNEELVKKMRMLRNHGMDRSLRERLGPNASYAYDIKTLGRNYRITDIQCALGYSQLKKLDGIIEKRTRIAAAYAKAFDEMDGITTPFVKNDVKHAWHLYTILLDKGMDRDKFFNEMRTREIGVNVHYIPIYMFSYYKKLEGAAMDKNNFPNTNDVFSRIITLPLYPGLETIEIEKVVNAVRECTNSDKG